MKSSDFKWFKERVANAVDDNADIFHAGYLWLDLTDKQAVALIPIMKAKGAKRVEVNGRVGWEYSWFTIWEED